MLESGLAGLVNFALYIDRPVWVKEKPSAVSEQVVWSKVGPEEITIIALRHGFIVFDFNQSKGYVGGVVPAYKTGEDNRVPKNVQDAHESRLSLAYRRLTYMNAFLCALYSSISTVQKRGGAVQEPVNPSNYFQAKKIDDKAWKIITDGRKIDQPMERSLLEVDTLDNAIEILNKLYDKIGDTSYEVLSLIYQACFHYQNHQFSSAHIIAWTTIEVFLNDAWEKLQNEKDKNNGGHTIISGDRRKILNGRDYTASIISQILSLTGVIDDEILERLENARKKRNKFAHQLERIDSNSAGKAIRLATDMITKAIDTRVTSQLSFSYWGI